MRKPSNWIAGLGVAAALAGAIAIAGCGGGGDDTATSLKIGASESGKTTSFSVPGSIEGGLVEIKFTNEGKAPHGVQLVRYEGDHTAQDAFEQLGSESEKTPDWLRGEGGIGSVPGGESATATVNLEAGNFVIVDAAAFNEEGAGKPATAELKVTEGDSGDLPETSGKVVAEETGKDEFAWDVSGLKAGKQQITFESEGDDSIHLILAVPVKGKTPSLAEVKEDFRSEGPPPSYLDFEDIQSTAVLDGGKAQTTPIDLKPGKYIFFCPLTDRDGGKPHDQEGLLSIETVQ
jgi:hypothetical protein